MESTLGCGEAHGLSRFDGRFFFLNLFSFGVFKKEKISVLIEDVLLRGLLLCGGGKQHNNEFV